MARQQLRHLARPADQICTGRRAGRARRWRARPSRASPRRGPRSRSARFVERQQPPHGLRRGLAPGVDHVEHAPALGTGRRRAARGSASASANRGSTGNPSTRSFSGGTPGPAHDLGGFLVGHAEKIAPATVPDRVDARSNPSPPSRAGNPSARRAARCRRACSRKTDRSKRPPPAAPRASFAAERVAFGGEQRDDAGSAGACESNMPVHRRPQPGRAVHQRDVALARATRTRAGCARRARRRTPPPPARPDVIEGRAKVAGGGIVAFAEARRADENFSGGSPLAPKIGNFTLERQTSDFV